MLTKETDMSSDKLQTVSPKFNEVVLDDIMRDYGGHQCTSWKFENGDFGKGDSYLSEVFRITLEDDTSQKTEDGTPLTAKIIVKSIPKNIGRRKTFRSADFFRNEINFYNVVLSEFNKFQQAKLPKNPFDESSK